MKPLTIAAGLQELKWPSPMSRNEQKPLGSTVRDKQAEERRMRAAWMSLLAAATRFEAPGADDRAFARRELRRASRVLIDSGFEGTPRVGDGEE